MNRKQLRDIYNRVSDESMDSNGKQRILVVDFMNTFVRSWTVAPAINQDGYHIGGISGFLLSVGAAIRNLKATQVFFAVDGVRGNSGRRKIYSEYKGNRNNRFSINRAHGDNEDPEASFKRQLARVIEYLETLPGCILQVDHAEADDTMQYLTHLFEDKNEVLLMSSDKDFLQLVNDKVFVWSPTKKKLYDSKSVEEEWNIRADNLPILRAFLGDASDNIPGIKGIGPKTIMKHYGEVLNAKYHDDDSFLEAIRDIDCTTTKKVNTNEEIFRRNFQLMNLHEDVMSASQKSNIRETIKKRTRDVIDIKEFLNLCYQDRLFDAIRDPQQWAQNTFFNISKLDGNIWE